MSLLLLQSLADSTRGRATDLSGCLVESTRSATVGGTRATCYCYHVKLDGNCQPLMDDFIRVICSAAVYYAIPRQQIEAAKRRLLETNSTDDFMQLAKEARELFTDAALTGEGGELLLFLFAEKVLR